MQPEVGKDIDQDVTRGKRPRSTSLSSASSVATISTDASDTRGGDPRPTIDRSNHHRTESRSSSDSQLTSTSNRLEEEVSRRNQEDRHVDSSRSLARHRSHKGQHPSDDSDEVESSARRRLKTHDRHESERRNKRRRSHSADNVPGPGGVDSSSDPTRQRSLSPYSRRLALTQAMNSGGR